MQRPPPRLCGSAAGGTSSGPSRTIRSMDARVAVAVYFLIAAAAAFVTASRNLPLPLLLGLLTALAVVAILVRSQVIKAVGTTRVALGFIVVYVVTYFAVVALFVR